MSWFNCSSTELYLLSVQLIIWVPRRVTMPTVFWEWVNETQPQSWECQHSTRLTELICQQLIYFVQEPVRCLIRAVDSFHRTGLFSVSACFWWVSDMVLALSSGFILKYFYKRISITWHCLVIQLKILDMSNWKQSLKC